MSPNSPQGTKLDASSESQITASHCLASTYKARPAGREPATCGLEVWHGIGGTNGLPTTSENADSVLAFLANQSPDLAAVVERWKSLPAEAKTRILEIVKTVTRF